MRPYRVSSLSESGAELAHASLAEETREAQRRLGCLAGGSVRDCGEGEPARGRDTPRGTPKARSGLPSAA